MDEDRVKGSAKKTGGKIKEGVGEAVGDEKMKSEGQADQVEGEAQNTWGSAKDTAREATEKK